MSLLLDALRRAEQEKLARQQADASNDAAPQAGVEPPAREVARTPPGLELQPMGPAATGMPRSEEAMQAHMVFQAKGGPETRRGRGMLWITLALIAVVVGSAGAYVWYQLRVLAPGVIPVATRRPPPPPLQPMASGSPPPAPSRAPGDASRPDPGFVRVEPPPLPGPTAAFSLPSTSTPRANPIVSAAPPPAPRPARVEPVDAEAAQPRAAVEAPVAARQGPRFTPSVEAPRVPADVTNGWRALREGDIGQARRSYDAALARDPLSVDAHLGMATVEAQAGNRTLAGAHYRRVLELDSRNATALAGLAAMADGASPEAVESQLREDVARFPESAALQFALGSHYVGRGRWGEAQAAFFEAYRLDPANPDILYNLAVSLDHIGQSRLAADFYRRAVEASAGRPTQFDAGAVRRRLEEIAAAR